MSDNDFIGAIIKKAEKAAQNDLNYIDPGNEQPAITVRSGVVNFGPDEAVLDDFIDEWFGENLPRFQPDLPSFQPTFRTVTKKTLPVGMTNYASVVVAAQYNTAQQGDGSAMALGAVSYGSAATIIGGEIDGVSTGADGYHVIGISTQASNAGTGKLASAIALRIASFLNDGSPAPSVAYGMDIQPLQSTGDTTAAVHIQNQGSGATNYAIYSEGGRIAFQNTTPPEHNNSSGVIGEIALDANYLYVCTADNNWKRITLDGTSW